MIKLAESGPKTGRSEAAGFPLRLQPAGRPGKKNPKNLPKNPISLLQCRPIWFKVGAVRLIFENSKGWKRRGVQPEPDPKGEPSWADRSEPAQNKTKTKGKPDARREDPPPRGTAIASRTPRSRAPKFTRPSAAARSNPMRLSPMRRRWFPLPCNAETEPATRSETSQPGRVQRNVKLVFPIVMVLGFGRAGFESRNDCWAAQRGPFPFPLVGDLP